MGDREDNSAFSSSLYIRNISKHDLYGRGCTDAENVLQDYNCDIPVAYSLATHAIYARLFLFS